MPDLFQQMSSLVMQSRKAIAVMGAPLSVIILTEGNSEIQSYRVCGVMWLSGIVMVTYVCSQADRHHFLETMCRCARTKKPCRKHH